MSSGENIMAYVIAEPCIGTKEHGLRVDACPVDCIHPKKDEPNYAEAEMLYIDPVECIDCCVCVPVCPVSAIFALDDLPEKSAHFTPKNANITPSEAPSTALPYMPLPSARHRLPLVQQIRFSAASRYWTS